MIKDYYPGKGCQCYAHSEYECACPDVDWTETEVYELRDEVKNLEESVKVLTDDRNRWHELFEEGVKQQREAERQRDEAIDLVKAPSIGKNIKIIEKFKNLFYTVIATIAALYVYYLISGEVICFKHL